MHRHHQFLPELLLAGVVWDPERVEARLRRREPTPTTNHQSELEPRLRPIVTLQLCKPGCRRAAGSGAEVKQLCPLFLIELPHHAPEPPNHRCARRQPAFVLGGVLPIVHVDLGHPAEQQLEVCSGAALQAIFYQVCPGLSLGITVNCALFSAAVSGM